eukprot:CAMPEP_0201719490 /NCGR_PEP_ID=MMETSP0593-20130828/4665_1 /ASSEMBLY_ACC=CAM_ASM_000672 /TAXON_ID=267983 /ORGANISM="Skeletonema japonicum, Strain CCMP2506" /LENGTH=504 /DNA_ID=CAMNT_0048209933 /DNA_START=111 /DNA_END=1625 /DNA_ORIENTATION=+
MNSIASYITARKKRAVPLLLAIAISALIAGDQLISPVISQYLRKDSPYATVEVVQTQTETKGAKVHVPATLDLQSQRTLSLNLGGGNCKWQPPVYTVPDDIDFYKTVIAGFPSGDKRMIFVQMEALTSWPCKDEWDFEHIGMSNHPFIKANYPHHEGIWGWGEVADQVVMMIRNIRRSMVEYHDILWDIGYAKTWEDASLFLDNLYSERPPMTDFLAWRDERVMDEVYWYGWFIDYYMEGGLMRDMFTHKTTTKEHWDMLMMPTVYTRAELDYDLVVGADTVVDDAYDPNCATITEGCEPVAVISAENLRDYSRGPAETALIGNVLNRDSRIGEHVIEQETWDCIWSELIENGKGLKTVYDRPGFVESDYNFSAEMLQEMIKELDRLIAKYGASPWSSKTTANKLVSLLSEHRVLIQEELDDVLAGRRVLAEKDFLGPEERERLRKLADNEANEEDQKDYSRYFFEMDRKLLEIRRVEMRKSLYQKRKEAEEAAKKLDPVTVTT